MNRKVLGINILILILLVQVVSILPISPVKIAYAEPLTLQGTSITRSRSYTWSEFGTIKSTTINLRGETNGTVILSRDSQEVFRIKIPTALIGTTALFSNSTYVAVNLTAGNFFIKQLWKTDSHDFKLTICWKLPLAVTFRLPLNKNADDFGKGRFVVGNLRFDWSDALANGYLSTFENSTKSIRVSIPAEGCLDPLVGTSSYATSILSQKSVVYSGNDWYVFYHDGSNVVYRCGIGGNSFGATTTVNVQGGLTRGFDIQPNSTQFLIAAGPESASTAKVYRSVTPSASCGNSISTSQTIVTSAKATWGIAQNATGFLFALEQVAADAQKVWRSSASGNSWTDRGNGCTAQWGAQLLNWTSGRIVSICTDETGIDSRIFYSAGNQTFGTFTTFTTDVLANNGNRHPFACVAGVRVFCAWQTGGNLKYASYDGSSWSAATTVFNVGAIKNMFGLVKNNGVDTVYVFWISGSSIKWNSTNTAGTSFTDSGSFFIGAQTSADQMAVSIRPNGTGWVGLAWQNGSASPFNVQFHAFQAFVPAVTNYQLTLNYFARDGTTAIQSLSPRCRLEANNGTITVVTGASGSCIARVRNNQPIRVVMILAGSPVNNTAFIKSSNTTQCCSNKWNVSGVSADVTYTVRTSVSINEVLRFEKGSRLQLVVPDWYRIYFPHNGTTLNYTATSGSITFPLMPTGNSSTSLLKVSKFGASITTKPNILNATGISINATANSVTMEIITRDFVETSAFYKNSGLILTMGGVTCASWQFTAPNGTVLTPTTASYETTNGTHTLGAITCGTQDVKTNATTWSPTANGATFSYRLNIFRLSLVRVYSVDRVYILTLFRFGFTNANGTASNLTSTQYAGFEIFGTTFTPTRAKSDARSGNINVNQTAITISNDINLSFRVLLASVTFTGYAQNGNSAFSFSAWSMQAPNNTVLSLGSGNSLVRYFPNGTITPDAIRIWGGDVLVNRTAFTFGGTAATYSFRVLIALNTLRFYMDGGNSAVTFTSVTLQAPNLTVSASLGTASSISVYMQNASWTPDAFRIFGGNTKANSTAFTVSGSSAQTFSFRLRIYTVTIQGVRKDGATTAYDNFMLRGTWPNSTSIASVNSSSQAISSIFLQNGSNTLTAWWVVGSRAIIVNNSFSYSFTSASTLNFILQVLEEASSGPNFRFGLNISTVEFRGWNADNRTLRFNSTSSTSPQILLRFLTSTYQAAPDEVWHNGSLHNDPCCFEGNNRWFHNTAHVSRFLWNSIVFRQPTPGAGPGPGPGAGGGIAPDVPPPAPVKAEITPETAEVVKQLPSYAGLGTIAIVAIIVFVSLVGKARDSRSISTMLKSSTKRPKFTWKREKVKR